MTNFNAKHLANTARDLINLLRTNTKATMAGTVVEWNTCVKQSGLNGTYDFPTTGYTRKAQLIADLDRAADQLDALAIEADRAAGRPVDEEGNDTREWCGNDIEAAHAEALAVDEVLNFAVKVACCHADLDSVTHNAIRNAVDHVRHDLLQMNRYNASFIVKMMISAKGHARKARASAKVRFQEMVARCATATTDQIISEIPF